MVYVFFSIDSQPELSDLVVVLKSVDWHQLGTQLKVPDHKLRTIDGDYNKSERKLNETLQYWLKNDDESSWEKICEALKRIGDHAKLVQEILTNYCSHES